MSRAPSEPRGIVGARFIAPSQGHDRAATAQTEPPAAADEVAAIVAALAMREEGDPAPELATPISHWALAGRRLATRGIAAGPTSGWGRPRKGPHG